MKKRIRQVRIEDLRIDPDVQRDLRPTKAKRMAAKFNPDLLGIILVSERADGTLVVFDGQHRVVAAKTANYTGTLTAAIYSDLTHKDEATMFLGHNDASPVRALDKLRVRVTAEEDTAVDIHGILARRGFTIGAGPGDRIVQAAAAVEKVYKLDQKGRILARVFNVIADAWPTDAGAAHGLIVISLGEFIRRFPDCDDQRLARLVAADRPVTLIGDIKSMKSIQHLRTHDEAGALVLVNVYNRGLRGQRRLRLVS